MGCQRGGHREMSIGLTSDKGSQEKGDRKQTNREDGKGGGTMLDQNTDRTWWMIGAIVVGAAVIGAALLIFPDLLGQVTGMFGDEIGKVEIEKHDPRP